MIYFNCYITEHNRFWIFFGIDDNGLSLLEGHEDEYEEVVSYIEDNLPKFGELFESTWTKIHDLSFKDAKYELKEICKKLILDGFVFSEKLGEIGYEQLFPLEGGDYPNPVFLEDDF